MDLIYSVCCLSELAEVCFQSVEIIFSVSLLVACRVVGNVIDYHQ